MARSLGLFGLLLDWFANGDASNDDANETRIRN